MNQLVLSENTTIELNGKQITLQEGDAIQVSRSLFKIDNEFEVNTEQGKILVEPGDRIRAGGQHKATDTSEFVSDGKRFAIEKGDDFDIVTTEDTMNSEYVIEEAFWDELKRGFLGQDTATDELSKILNALIKFGLLVTTKAERIEEETGENPYESLLKSKEMKTLNELFKLSKEGLGGQKITTREIIDILDLDDPVELINRIRDELIKIGDKRLANRIEEMVPKGILGKISQVWKNVTGQKMAKGEISGRTVPASKKIDHIRSQKIWDFIRKSGATTAGEAVKKTLEYFGDKTNAEEIKQTIKQHQATRTKPASQAKSKNLSKSPA